MIANHLPSQHPALDDPLPRYKAELKEQAAAAPQAPGVYTFHGNANDFPLYIGKSINIRARLLSHLRSADAARLLQQTGRISYIPTAGEISALLLEARMIKQLQPLFNHRLRKTRSTCSYVLSEDGLQIRYTEEAACGEAAAYGQERNIYGLFKNQRAAKDRLRLLADEYRLCLSLLGIEPTALSRGCFRSAVQKCAGACCGKEAIETHNKRLQTALEQYKIALWPYSGPVALKESFGRLKSFHILDNWLYHGSFKTARSLIKNKRQQPALFDADMYKILVKPILCGDVDVIELS